MTAGSALTRSFMIVQAAFITSLSVTCKCGHNNTEPSMLSLCAGVISTFLHVHPFGANIEYLWSYIQRLDAKVNTFLSFFCSKEFIFLSSAHNL